MKLPNPERAIVDMAKLRGYCLNANHRRGRHKARVFAAALGLTVENAELLRDALLTAAQTYDARPAETIEYGQLYMLDFQMNGPAGEAMVRSGWIVRMAEDFPRLTSCFVL
jgi:hypothetical protein